MLMSSTIDEGAGEAHELSSVLIFWKGGKTCILLQAYMGTEGGLGGGALGSISLPDSILTPNPNLAAPCK